ncbi:redoxin domain-containing protein [Pseudoduganella sp. FT25W]|uniref:Redoxin domain-containing protein n=1 Tax=Duganella alba TaxID=2666081 RepID=A0A6L5QKJ7_9BURK|nr:SCO family protein [Duganella alba]MRX10324.1 redoxin domain-containing protein [Duganella alba]MRX20050.1 redoxin domain-containing protein [Duganella alba]
MQRRQFISSLALLPLAAGSAHAASGFTALDITGSAIGPDYQLFYGDGKPASLRDFKGKVVMLFFGFTQCPDVCPTALARSVEIKRLLGPDGDKLQVVFVTVDPERDTAPLLAEYMHAFDPTFVAVRGNLEQTAKAAKDFKIFYRKVPSGSSYTMDHTALTYVFDASGKIRLAMKHAETAQQCADDLRLLMHPKKETGFLKGLFQ